MPIQTSVYVRWDLSPRVIYLPDPMVSITIQDLVDTCRYHEDLPENMDDDYLIAAAGKEDLGGGLYVGITATLNNAYVYFEARSTPLVSGSTATSTDSTGMYLEDTTAGFTGDGIQVGDTVFNATNAEMATILEITDDENIRSFPLSGGGGLGWTTGDSYLIYSTDVCEITGGNLVAVDSLGASMNPYMPSPNIFLNSQASSSATLLEAQAISSTDIDNIADAVWDEATADHQTSGTFGLYVSKIPLIGKLIALLKG